MLIMSFFYLVHFTFRLIKLLINWGFKFTTSNLCTVIHSVVLLKWVELFLKQKHWLEVAAFPRCSIHFMHLFGCFSWHWCWTSELICWWNSAFSDCTKVILLNRKALLTLDTLLVLAGLTLHLGAGRMLFWIHNENNVDNTLMNFSYSY